MGCDIHPHIEVRIQGIWYHYSIPIIKRCYPLFTRICGVRECDNIIPIDKPRGIPKDISIITKIELDWIGIDSHSHTWLNKKELNDLIRWHEAYLENEEINTGYTAQHHQWGYMTGNNFLEYKDSNPSEYEDVRFICWFDN